MDRSPAGIGASQATNAACNRLRTAIGLGCSRRPAIPCPKPATEQAHPGAPPRRWSDTAIVTAAARPYAPRPLGQLPPSDVTPPPVAQPIEILNHLHVTNLGTLLDVLA